MTPRGSSRLTGAREPPIAGGGCSAEWQNKGAAQGPGAENKPTKWLIYIKGKYLVKNIFLPLWGSRKILDSGSLMGHKFDAVIYG